MVVHEEQRLRKRLRDDTSPRDKPRQSAKRRKAAYPPRFWDTLSKVHLTRSALKEFDRRIRQGESAPASATRETASRRILRPTPRRLREFAKDGGPDLSALRGYSDTPTAAGTMSQSNSASRKRSQASGSKESSTTRKAINTSPGKTITTSPGKTITTSPGKTITTSPDKTINTPQGKTTNTSPYNAGFLQKMIDKSVYPAFHKPTDKSVPPEPKNMDEILRMLREPRRSLSPSSFSESLFKEFQHINEQVNSEAETTAKVIPYITGSNDSEYETAGEVFFYNLEKFDPDVTVAKPDEYHGARPDKIDPRVRVDLSEYIIPSSRADLPAAPNFFREDKGTDGKANVAKRQAMYDGAIGARGMFHLQNYGNPTPAYDGNAYTISTTYHPALGMLGMYATHPGPPASGRGDRQYYTTQLDTFAMTGNADGFRNGVAAYRNARDWTRAQRNHLIAEANGVAQRQSTETRSFGLTVDAVDNSPAANESFSSETSTDELAPEYETRVKRPRRRMSTR